MIDTKPFAFRRYVESDADPIYEAYAQYTWSNIQPYFNGPCVVKEKAEFLEKFQEFAQKHYRPPIIANADNSPCGVYHIDYNRANRYNELSVYLWRDTHLAKAVLKEVINQAFGKEIPNQYFLIEVPGYAPELKQAADDLGLDLAGTILNYLRHDNKLYHKYLYVISFEKWRTAKN